MLFLESKTIPGSLSFCCVIALELHYIVFKLIRRAKPTPSFDSKKGNEISIDDVRMGSYLSCSYEKNGMMLLMKKFQLNKIMF